MSADEIVKILRGLGDQIEREYRAEIQGLFGSYARGEQHEDSDLDVLVNFREKATLLDMVGLGQFLEEHLDCKVDIVSRRALRDELKPQVMAEMIPV